MNRSIVVVKLRMYLSLSKTVYNKLYFIVNWFLCLKLISQYIANKLKYILVSYAMYFIVSLNLSGAVL